MRLLRESFARTGSIRRTRRIAPNDASTANTTTMIPVSRDRGRRKVRVKTSAAHRERGGRENGAGNDASHDHEHDLYEQRPRKRPAPDPERAAGA